MTTMSNRNSDQAVQNAPANRATKAIKPAERRGIPGTGRIVRLHFGQGHGYIRLANHREVYFHRADMQEGTSINDFGIGDVVAFELLEDPVSGARALRVKRRSR